LSHCANPEDFLYPVLGPSRHMESLFCIFHPEFWGTMCSQNCWYIFLYTRMKSNWDQTDIVHLQGKYFYIFLIGNRFNFFLSCISDCGNIYLDRLVITGIIDILFHLDFLCHCDFRSLLKILCCLMFSNQLQN
jgi:hypothetical protein